MRTSITAPNDKDGRLHKRWLAVRRLKQARGLCSSTSCYNPELFYGKCGECDREDRIDAQSEWEFDRLAEIEAEEAMRDCYRYGF